LERQMAWLPIGAYAGYRHDRGGLTPIRYYPPCGNGTVGRRPPPG
jgi:hypothetical protein